MSGKAPETCDNWGVWKDEQVLHKPSVYGKEDFKKQNKIVRAEGSAVETLGSTLSIGKKGKKKKQVGSL